MKNALIVLISVISIPTYASQLYVSVSADPNTLDGPVYKTIQEAVDISDNNDTVCLLDLLYIGPGNRDINLKGKSIKITGKPEDPDTVVIDCEGKSEPHRGFIFINGEDYNTVIEGITIINGTAPPEDPNGGAIYCKQSGPTILNCIISDNMAMDGSGIFGSNGPIKDCIIMNNFAGSGGGGIYGCSGPINNCIIVNNHANSFGGGLAHCMGDIDNCYVAENTARYGGGLNNCHGRLTDCTISENTGFIFGGGLYDCDGIIKNCEIIKNNSERGAGLAFCSGNIFDCTISDNGNIDDVLMGGGLYCCNGLIHRCNITGNEAKSGGGIFYSMNVLSNCIISGNRAKYGGAVSENQLQAKLLNCTLTGNVALLEGGALYNCSGSMENCIVTQNRSKQIEGGNIEVSFCNIEGSYPGINNIDVDPHFAQPGFFVDVENTPNNPLDDVWSSEEFNFHLLWDSPCKDQGDPNAVNCVRLKDIDGEPWKIGLFVDIGADEIGEVQADFNHDGTVDMKDFAKLSSALSSNEGDSNWDVFCDLDNDEDVDIDDALEFNHYWAWNGWQHADVDNDGYIGYGDIDLFSRYWLSTVEHLECNYRYDLNEDGIINEEDLFLITDNWLWSASSI